MRSSSRLDSLSKNIFIIYIIYNQLTIISSLSFTPKTVLRSEAEVKLVISFISRASYP